jgi:hypothetical protein
MGMLPEGGNPSGSIFLPCRNMERLPLFGRKGRPIQHRKALPPKKGNATIFSTGGTESFRRETSSEQRRKNTYEKTSCGSYGAGTVPDGIRARPGRRHPCA